MLQSVREVLVNIHTKFELFRCLVCPTIEINICSILLIKSVPNKSSKVMLHYIVDTNIYSGMLKDIKLNSIDKLGATSDTNFEKYMLCIIIKYQIVKT